MSLPSCALTFIKNILCGNSVLRSTFRTFLNSQILLAEGEIALISSQIARLDILNIVTNLEIQTLKAVQNKIQSDLNVLGVPMAANASCPTISVFLAQAQGGAAAKKLAALQNLIYTLNRRQYVANALTAEQKQLQSYVATAQEFLNNIDSVCNP